MGKISVIVPVYNVEKYINRCVNSILEQTFTNFDLVLVDDGSPDSCGGICDEYAKTDNRIIVIHQNNGGVSAARNAGIDWSFENSDSEWLSFIDGDDWVHPQYLESLYNAVIRTGFDIAICGFEGSVGDNPIVDEDKLKPAICNTEMFYVENNCSNTVAWGKLYRKKCFDEIRYPIGKIHEDEFVTYKILFKYRELSVINQPLYAYYKNEGGLMKSKWSPSRMEAFNAIEEQLQFFKKYGFEHAAVKSRIKYMFFASEFLNNDDVDSKYKKLIRKMLRNFLRVNHISLLDSEYAYEAAYPRMMYLYWGYRSVLNKITIFGTKLKNK